MTQPLDDIQARLVTGDPVSPEEERRLNVAFRVRADLSEAVARDVQMHRLLSAWNEPETVDDDFTAGVLSALENEQPVERATPPALPVRPGVTTVHSRPRGSSRMMAGIITACAALLVGGIVLLLMFAGGDEGNQKRRPRNDDRIAKTQHTKSPQPIPPHRKIESPRKTPQIVNKEPKKQQTEQPTIPIARLTDGSGCRWKTGVAPSGDLKAKPLELVQGTAEFTFHDGAVVNVTGPATFVMHTSGAIQLTRGRLHAEVPKRAVGFTVITPASVIIDLGTKFEVNVDDKGVTDLLVLQGRVEHRRWDEKSSSDSGRVLKAGEKHREVPPGAGGKKISIKVQANASNPFRAIRVHKGKTYHFFSQEEYERFKKKHNLK